MNIYNLKTKKQIEDYVNEVGGLHSTNGFMFLCKLNEKRMDFIQNYILDEINDDEDIKCELDMGKLTLVRDNKEMLTVKYKGNRVIEVQALGTTISIQKYYLEKSNAKSIINFYNHETCAEKADDEIVFYLMHKTSIFETVE